MFPIRDHNPSRRTPYVTYGLLIANSLIFISYWSILNDRAIINVWSDWALVPGWVSDGHQLYTYVTSTFLHGGFMHLAGNMLFLWIFGDNLEDELGHVVFALFYLACGVGANMLHVWVEPGSMVPLVGASGAIAGILGGYLLLFPKARVDVIFIFIVFFKIWPLPAWVMLGLWFAFQLFQGAVADVNGADVAYWAHVGGFIVGLILILPFWLKRGAVEFWNRNDGHPDNPPAEYKVSRSSIPVVRKR